MHEVQGPGELAACEVTLPNFHGNALRGVPGVGAESLGASEAFHPKAGLCRGSDGARGSDEGGVEWKRHCAWIEVQRIS